METRDFNVREVGAHRTRKCPECGNNFGFVYHIEELNENEFRMWISCSDCGFSASESEDGYATDTYADMGDEYVLAALDAWNASV